MFCHENVSGAWLHEPAMHTKGHHVAGRKIFSTYPENSPRNLDAVLSFCRTGFSSFPKDLFE